MAPGQRNSPVSEEKGLLRMYAGHVPVLGGVSPLRSREHGPLSEGKGVCREAMSEGSLSHSHALTNRNRIVRRRAMGELS